jgi:hypothetical protein
MRSLARRPGELRTPLPGGFVHGLHGGGCPLPCHASDEGLTSSLGRTFTGWTTASLTGRANGPAFMRRAAPRQRRIGLGCQPGGHHAVGRPRPRQRRVGDGGGQHPHHEALAARAARALRRINVGQRRSIWRARRSGRARCTTAPKASRVISAVSWAGSSIGRIITRMRWLLVTGSGWLIAVGAPQGCHTSRHGGISPCMAYVNRIGSRPKTRWGSGSVGCHGRPAHASYPPVYRGPLTPSVQLAKRGQPDLRSGAVPGVRPSGRPRASQGDGGAGQGRGRK